MTRANIIIIGDSGKTYHTGVIDSSALPDCIIDLARKGADYVIEWITPDSYSYRTFNPRYPSFKFKERRINATYKYVIDYSKNKIKIYDSKFNIESNRFSYKLIETVNIL